MASPKISAAQQRKIEVLINGWRGKLTWDALVDRIRIDLGLLVTRQTLCTYTGIDNCFKVKKKQLRGVTQDVYHNIKISDVALLEKVNSLQAKIVVLERNNAAQLRMIERILSNANEIPNLDLASLIKLRSEDC